MISADVQVKNAIIGGKLVGNINATNKIELQTGSHVEGDISTARLVIDEGVDRVARIHSGCSLRDSGEEAVFDHGAQGA